MEWLSPIVSRAAIAWRRFVQAVDWVLLCYLRVANPKYVVATFVLLNVLIGLSTLVLAKSWDEFYTISGYWVTLTGFLVAIGELYRARTVTDQIQEALGREIRIQRGRFYRFCLERAKATLWDVQACVLGFDWSLAVMRLRDLTENLSHINSISPAADNRWTTFSTSAHNWVVLFSTGHNGR